MAWLLVLDKKNIGSLLGSLEGKTNYVLPFLFINFSGKIARFQNKHE